MIKTNRAFGDAHKIFKMKLLKNSGFLSQNTVENCFSFLGTNQVDKQICGNGFTTAFCQIRPAKNKVNVIIAPNRAVPINKEQSYKHDQGSNRIKFFYKDSEDSKSKNIFQNAEVLFFVADSFLNYKDQLLNLNIDKLLIDEFHSVETQSLYRKQLIDFIQKVQQATDSSTKITTVTASPNLFSRTNIKIINEDISETVIHQSNNQIDAVDRIKYALDLNEKVVIFSNSKHIICNIMRSYKDVNLIVGVTLQRDISELAKININTESNLTICSSKGFEGHDLIYKDSEVLRNVFYFEDRSTDHQSSYISNLYQAISRTRQKADYIEYCRVDLKDARKQNFKDLQSAVDHFVSDRFMILKANRTRKEIVSTSEKMQNKYSKYHQFVIFNQDQGCWSVKINQTAINLHKEKLLYDYKVDSAEFQPFLTDRKMIFKDIRTDLQKRIDKIKKYKTVSIRMLKTNAEYIKENDLFDSDYLLPIDIHLESKYKTIRQKYLADLELYTMRKNYNSDRPMTDRERTAALLLIDDDQFNDLKKKINAAHKKYTLSKSISDQVKDEKIVLHEDRSEIILCRLIMMFARDRISCPSKWVGNRNYNLLTETSLSSIEIVSAAFNVRVDEVDIRSCNSRILYALCDLHLPENFYGPNKINKFAINKFLNNFFFKPFNKSSEYEQRAKAINQFRKFNFAEVVIEYLMQNHFMNKFRSDLFNMLTYYENVLISVLMDKHTGSENNGVIRRHDSELIFDNKNDLSEFNNIDFLSQKGWFQKDVKIIDISAKKTADLNADSENDFTEKTYDFFSEK